MKNFVLFSLALTILPLKGTAGPSQKPFFFTVCSRINLEDKGDPALGVPTQTTPHFAFGEDVVNFCKDHGYGEQQSGFYGGRRYASFPEKFKEMARAQVASSPGEFQGVNPDIQTADDYAHYFERFPQPEAAPAA